MNAKLRVLVVEDSLTVRACLREALAEDPLIELVGEAVNGQQAVEMCGRLRPDVVTMDIILPVMSGLAATEQIMAHFPTPILVVSSADRSELLGTYDALAAGAVDVLDKPLGSEADSDWDQRLRTAVRMVSRIRVITHPRGRLKAAEGRPTTAPAARTSAQRVPVVAIGASTGGPGAVVKLLHALPPGYATPILLVQHLFAHESFATAFTDWLSSQTGRPVSYARGGELVDAAAGSVVMAPPDHHLVVRGGVLGVNTEPQRHHCRPSVDVLFESVAAEYGPTAIGCLLTGMGRDGAAGLLAMRRAGAHTFAQDEASSVVYGMPREAVLLGAAVEVMSPDHIGARLGGLTSASHHRRDRWHIRS